MCAFGECFVDRGFGAVDEGLGVEVFVEVLFVDDAGGVVDDDDGREDADLEDVHEGVGGVDCELLRVGVGLVVGFECAWVGFTDGDRVGVDWDGGLSCEVGCEG